MNNVSFKKWCEQDEKIHVKINQEYFKLTAGLNYSQKKISALEKQSAESAKVFLKNFGKPEILKLDCISSVASEVAHKNYLELNKKRNELISHEKYKFQGKSVNWATWRQFVAKNKARETRKNVFDTFISKIKLISPYIRKNFHVYKNTFAQYNIDILDSYLKYQSLNYEQVYETIIKLRNFGRKRFPEYHENKFLGKKLEYIDDLYFTRNVVFEKLGKHFSRLNPVKEVNVVLKNMGISTNKIKVDSASRPRKNPSASCHWIKVPSDVRVLYKKENAIQDFNSVFHEYGHAIHASSIKKNLPYWQKYCLPSSLTEIFSIFLENLQENEIYLNNLVKNKDAVTDILERFKFLEFFFITFYSANSLFKLKIWQEWQKQKDIGMEKANELYAKLSRECMGIEYPGAYWQLHHVMADYLIYEPSYMIAATRAAELESKITNIFGEKWWQEKKAGKYLVDIMSKGRGALGEFRKTDLNQYFKKLS